MPVNLQESSACGVGLTADRRGQRSHKVLQDTLGALTCSEHRGGCTADQRTGDGSGIMVEIPFELFGYERGEVAVASLFAPRDTDRAQTAFRVFEETFSFFDLDIIGYRDIPTNPEVLGEDALASMPQLRQAFIKRPPHVHSDEAFDTALYHARQLTRTKERKAGIKKEFFFASLSANTVVYKALTRGEDLGRFYTDLTNPDFKTRFGVFHRRFSTNTSTAWDRAQPFRLIAHNGEINTISGNKAWAYSREQALGLPIDELLTHAAISDSGNCNEMVEALKYRSSIPYIGDVLSIMVPPAQLPGELHQLWSRAMEPWDGPAFLVFCDGTTVGARLDRNGFRPCRWTLTDDRFFLSSEAGNFPVNQSEVIQKGTLRAGTGVTVEIETGKVDLTDSGRSIARRDVQIDARLGKIEKQPARSYSDISSKQFIFRYTREDIELILNPMISTGKEPIGSMGNTARLSVLSEFHQPLFNYFYQQFAQVTNPPVDYIREQVVTELTTYLGRRPNVFAPKELIPPFRGIALRSHIMALDEVEGLHSFESIQPFRSRLAAVAIDCTFKRSGGIAAFHEKLDDLEEQVISSALSGHTIIILTDENASEIQTPLPSLLVLSAASRALNRVGLRLRSSLVLKTGDVRAAHHLACLVAFGADAVCPYLALAYARATNLKETEGLSPEEKEQNLIYAFETGLRRVMAKMGISVARSYQGSRLLACIGLGDDVTSKYFPDSISPVGGISLNDIAEQTLTLDPVALETQKLEHTYQYKEHPRGRAGEKHSMGVAQARLLHQLVRSDDFSEKESIYTEYLTLTRETYPTALRHLLQTKRASSPLELSEVEAIDSILTRFGSGAMSFGAISAESQRDLILAMQQIGGRSNSGEGGENPYYWSDGICASVKQVASARFGVTGQYLISGEEIQIKMAQGAKPGEGGQLMRAKVDEQIARARHASPGIDLISPPPMHDIYSIEDLKGLIYELKQFHPQVHVNVKLVAGVNIGTIAVGVAKAGADSIQISGGDGGTGAAALSSMKHAGLPWELGLIEVNQALLENGLRQAVEVRIDGGLSCGLDIVIGAALGADGFDFGKLLLVAEGCIMARICEKNTCPTGIATHAERFKRKYKGTSAHVVELLTWIAKDVQQQLTAIGVSSLSELNGRADLLEPHPAFEELRRQRGLDCSVFTGSSAASPRHEHNPFWEGVSSLNEQILEEAKPALAGEREVLARFSIAATDRAIPATLCGAISKSAHLAHLSALTGSSTPITGSAAKQISLHFSGSAGQGFGVLLPDGIELALEGEANDSVCKTMSGGEVVITPPAECRFSARDNMIIGNCALYGATGGRLFANGRAGDRFAVRNSGAIAVIEGVGLHACEYMTSGTVIVLGRTGYNVGAGMTGGELYLLDADEETVHLEYLEQASIDAEAEHRITAILLEYFKKTGSSSIDRVLEAEQLRRDRLTRWVPRA